MGYLQPSEYAAYGLTAETGDDWIATASALMDSYCQRTTLNPAQYVERLRMTAGARTVLLSHLPLVAVAPAMNPLVSVRARFAAPRRGELPQTMAEEISAAFSLPGSWTAVDVSSVDYFSETGEISLAQHILGLPYNEVEVTYTAGLATLPDAVKTACAQVVKNAQATPAFNVKQTRMDTMQMAYFSDSLLDEQVRSLLRGRMCREGWVEHEPELDVRAAAGVAARMADALLRSLGGCVALLRVPANAIAARDAEQLGLGEPQFQEISIGPAVYRHVMSKKADGQGERTELLVSATRVLEIVGSLGFASTNVLFAQVAGVVVNGTLLQIMGASSSEIFGQPYLYRLQLRGALNGVV